MKQLIVLADSLLKFLVPGLEKFSITQIQDILLKTQLEVIRTKQKDNDFLYEVKPICSFYDSSKLWVLAQEISVNLEYPFTKECQLKFNPFENSSASQKWLVDILKFYVSSVSSVFRENIMFFLGLLFGKDFSSPIFGFLINDFCKKFPELRNSLSSLYCRWDNSHKLLRAESTLELSNLLPIFKDLKDSWNLKVVSRLQKHNFLFEQDGPTWKIFWPPWYSQENLPPFSEILSRIVKLDQNSRLITSPIRLFDSSENNLGLIKHWKEIRKFLKEKGFVECNTCKFVNKSRNMHHRDYCLLYDNQVTLRDNLHFSCVFGVLLENLNKNNQIYPVFELSYCPWIQKWLLGIASVIHLETSEDFQAAWYSVDECKRLLKELFTDVLLMSAQWVTPEEKKYIPQLSASLIYNLINPGKEIIGSLLVHRLEQFEVRKKEIVSASVQLF